MHKRVEDRKIILATVSSQAFRKRSTNMFWGTMKTCWRVCTPGISKVSVMHRSWPSMHGYMSSMLSLGMQHFFAASSSRCSRLCLFSTSSN